VVGLHLGQAPEVFPTLAQEVEDDFHLARAVDSQANGAIEDILGDEEIVALPFAFEIERADGVHLMELVGLFGRWGGIGRAG
jgi:hypothetical protein